jgi:hypothetical protein
LGKTKHGQHINIYPTLKSACMASIPVSTGAGVTIQVVLIADRHNPAGGVIDMTLATRMLFYTHRADFA